jgi:hypothetical protein
MNRREEMYYQRAMARAEKLSTTEAIQQIDLTLMSAEQSVSRYRHALDAEYQQDQLRDIRFGLEVCLGILDVLLPD